MKTAAIILAAGQGKRMQNNIPKQYLQIREKPILFYSLQVFEQSKIDEIVLVTKKGEEEYCKKEIVERYGLKKVKYIISGGEERYYSVYHGLCTLSNIDYVWIHDGVRPFITNKVIEETIEQVKEYKACAMAVRVKDTIKLADFNNVINSTLPRENLWLIQTPQVFSYSLIKSSYDKLFNQTSISVTDDAMVVEQMMGYPIKLIEGSYCNIKITTPEDISIAEAFLLYNKDYNNFL